MEIIKDSNINYHFSTIKLTVFTTTYNRAYILPKLYESLLNQTNKNFKWLIIDDGSTDNTKDIVQQWILDDILNINYIYKTNGGMHTGHNSAYENIDTELNVCIDSDDAMPVNAIDNILNLWESTDNKNVYAGIIGLDISKNGKIIGTKIPSKLKSGSLSDLYQKYNITGDKKIILRTDIVNKYPKYPEYKNEKLVPLDVLYMMIGKDFDFLYTNDIYCIVDYQPDGSTHTIFKQYKESARGFAYARKVYIKNSSKFSFIIKNYLHLISSSLFAKDLSISFKGVNPVVTTLLFPFGIIFNFYIRLKMKK